MRISRLGRTAALLAVGFLLVGAAAAPAPRPLALPLTLLEIMRANVEIPAEGIWAVENEDKLSDQQWALAEQDSINIIAAATFISTGGTGKKDREWVAN